MSTKLRIHLRSNVVGYVALLVALSGTAYAANTVGSADIIDESILSQDIKNQEVKNNDLGPNVVGTGKIADGGVRTADVIDEGLGAADLASGAVGSEEVLDGSLTGSDVAVSTLSGSHIVDNSLKGSELFDGSVTGDKIANSTLTGADVSPSSLTGADIAPNSLSGLDIDESALEFGRIALDDGPDEGECEGVLSASPETCVDVSVILPGPLSRLLIIVSGGWSKESGDPAESLCRLQVNGAFPSEALLFMGDNSGFGGGHSAPRRAMPFTLNATTNRLDPGSYDVTLRCEDNSEGSQDTFIGNLNMSVVTVG